MEWPDYLVTSGSVVVEDNHVDARAFVNIGKSWVLRDWFPKHRGPNAEIILNPKNKFLADDAKQFARQLKAETERTSGTATRNEQELLAADLQQNRVERSAAPPPAEHPAKRRRSMSGAEVPPLPGGASAPSAGAAGAGPGAE